MVMGESWREAKVWEQDMVEFGDRIPRRDIQRDYSDRVRSMDATPWYF